MSPQDLIAALGRQLHLAGLALDKNNVCRVLFDDHAVDFEALPQEDVLYLIAEVGPLPADEDAAVCYRRLLEGNCYGLETADATLGVDPERNSVILHRRLDTTPLDCQGFETMVEHFFNRLRYWKDIYGRLYFGLVGASDEDSGSTA